MTRAQRIALAMYGPRKPWTVQWGECEYGFYPKPSRGCYEAMDDPDDIEPVHVRFTHSETVRYSTEALADATGLSPRQSVITGGNFGMPCA